MRRAEGDIIEGWPLPSRSLPLPAATATLLGSVALHAMLLSWVAWSGADGLARPTPSAPAEFSLVTSGDLFEARKPSREQAETQAALESPTIAPNSASSIDPPAADVALASEPGIAPQVDPRPVQAPETAAILRGSATELARLSQQDAASSDALQALPADSPRSGGVVAARPPSPTPPTIAAAEAERRPSRDAAADIVHPAPATGGARPISPEPAPLLDRVVEESVRQAAMPEPAAPSIVRPSGTPADTNASPAPGTVQAASAARPAARPAASSLRSMPAPEPATVSSESQALAARSAETRVVPAESRAGAEIVAAATVPAAIPSQRIVAVPAEDAAPAGPTGKGVTSSPASAVQAVDPAPGDAGQPAHVLQSSQAPEPAAPRELAAAIPVEPPAPEPVTAATAIQIPASAARVSSPASADIEDSAPVLQPSQTPEGVASRMLATAVSVEPSAPSPVAATTASIALAPPVADSPPPVATASVSAAPSASANSNEIQPVIAPRSEPRIADAPASQEVAAAVAPQAPKPTSFGARPPARQRIASETVSAARPDAAFPAVASRDTVPVSGATSLRPRETLPGSAASTPMNLAARVETETAASRTVPPAVAGTARADEPIRSARATPVQPVTDHATAVRSFVSTYDGGDCFLLATNDVSDDSASIAGFGASADPFVTFNDTFTTMQGFEADLGVRQVSQAHCPLISLLKSRGRPLPETLIDLTSSSIVSGGLVAGKIVPESGDVDPSAPPLLFLIDDAGQVHDARRFLQAGPEGWLFSFPLTLTGETGEAPVLLLAVFGVEPEERPEPFTSLPIEDFAGQLDDLLETFSLAYLTVRE